MQTNFGSVNRKVLFSTLFIFSLFLAVFNFVSKSPNNIETNLQSQNLTAQVISTSGQVAYWDMNETSGSSISDSGGSGFNGSVVGGGSFASGRAGNALSLSGSSQYGNIPSNQTVRLANTPYTISAWIQHNDSSYLSTSRGIVSKYDGTGYLMAINNGKLLTTHGGSAGSSSITGSTTMSPGNWYHVAMVYDQSTLKSYVNGNLQGTRNVASDIPGDGIALTIGNFSGNYFLGLIDEVRLYNRALDSGEINTIYTETGGGGSPTLSGPTSDTTSPTVSISTPSLSATVSNSITLSANASDNVGVVGVQFLVDGVSVGNEDTSSPFSISWDTSSVLNGSRSITARARDVAGNINNSSAVTITVNNQNTPVSGNPTTISSLSLSNITATGATLSWTAPANSAGQSVSSYDIRHSTSQITEGNWSGATQVSGEPSGGTPTSPRLYTLSGLSNSTQYYVGIKSSDGAGNISALSNVVNFTTTSAAGPVRIPLIDLGAQLYLNAFQGGLYENGTNSIPSDHSTLGFSAASLVRPLNTSGTSDPNGKIVMLSIGMSNTAMEFCNLNSGNANCDPNSFVTLAAADSRVNHTTLSIINGAMGAQDASGWDNTSDSNYNRIRDTILAPAGLSEQQVQVAWVKLAQIAPAISLPSSMADAYDLEIRLGNVVRVLKNRYPNIRQVFFSSRIYAGYTLGNLNPEPYAYETAFSPKWLIQAQINQTRNGIVSDTRAGNLNYNNGTAPWLAWGPYLWANGTTARSDGLTWQRGDLISDGVHPSSSGIQKVSNQLLTFFLSSPHTAWFRASGSVVVPPVSDVTAPILSSGLPNSQLTVGTTQATLSLTTNEASTCRYSTSANTSYASMSTTFSTTGSTNHSTSVSGLQNGTTYNYYVRCRDVANNVNTSDLTISFSVASAVVVPSGTSWYVSPSGSASGNGTIGNPWNLQTALNHPASVLAGHTIFLRGGTYTGQFISNLSGTSGSPIVVRNYNNERAIIDSTSAPSTTVPMYSALTIRGQNTSFIGLEITNSYTDRDFDDDLECWERQHCRSSAVDVFGTGIKIINSIIHDTGNGIGLWSSATEAEVYGNIVYYVGWQTTRGSGHGMYVQNNSGTKLFSDNVIFNGFHSGVHGYGSAGAAVRNITFDGNVIFSNGLLATDPNGWGILTGGNALTENNTITNNYLYNPSNYTRSNNLNLSYGLGSSGTTVRNNYSAGFGAMGYDVAMTGNYSISGNTFIGLLDGSSASQVSSNTNTVRASSSGLSNSIFVRPNTYERGRAHIVVYNWQSLPNVSVNLSNSGLQNGEVFEIKDVQNYFGSPVYSGTYSSANPTISLPTNLSSVSSIVGTVPNRPVHTSSEFNTYVVRRTGAVNNSPTPTPTPTPTPNPTPTPDPTPTPAPATVAISNLVSSQLTANTAIVSWNTNVPSNGQLFYGLTQSYGSQSSLIDNVTRTTSHYVFLSGLSPATIYNFRVTSVDASNNSTSSNNFTFNTLPRVVNAPVSSGGGGGGSVTPKRASPVVHIPAVTVKPVVANNARGGVVTNNLAANNATVNSNNGVSNNATTSRIYSLGTTTLKNGSRGEPVKELQRFLNTKLNLGLVVDGKLGPKTIAVIKKWQKDNGLVADGLVGKKTKAKMNGF